MTRAAGETGRRYQARLGTAIMLFARLRSDDRAFWFLGPATYVRHESEMAMQVTWRLSPAARRPVRHLRRRGRLSRHERGARVALAGAQVLTM